MQICKCCYLRYLQNTWIFLTIASLNLLVLSSSPFLSSGIHNNIAALRLMLLERCSLGTPFELNSTLKLVISTRSSNEEPIIVDGDPTTVDVDGDVGDDVLLLNKQPVVVDLSFDRNEQTMLSVCEVALGTKLGKEFVPAEEVFLVRQMKKDDTSQGIPSDQLMEHRWE